MDIVDINSGIVDNRPASRLVRYEMKIYLAGAITGKSYEEVVSAYQEKTHFFEELGYQVLCPMTGETNSIFERDKWMVSQSDIVLADLSTAIRVSIETMMELAWASLLGKHTILVMPKGGVHEHAFVLDAADMVFEELDSAYEYLSMLIGGV